MGKIYENITETIGRTPLVRLPNLKKAYDLKADLLVKLERNNPAGSAKDRVALSMISDAVESGKLKEGGLIIEPTSGNTGIGLAACCASLGYRCIIVMPDSMSVERIKLMKAYGADVELTPGALGMAGAIEKAKELCAENEGSIIAGQFDNPANPKAHYDTTGPEIWEDTEGKIDIFVSGVGTGGTLSGTGRFLKEKNPDVRIVAVEPSASPVLSGGKAGPHKIQGIGGGFIPGNFHRDVCDAIETVTDDDALFFAREIAKTEGILVGISSGAALCAAVRIAKLPENEGKTVVALLCDTGERYLSVF